MAKTRFDPPNWRAEPKGYGESWCVARPGPYGDRVLADLLPEEIARRIAACANACAGLPTGSLEELALLRDPAVRLATLSLRAEDAMHEAIREGAIHA
jgi:hypothetical protein